MTLVETYLSAARTALTLVDDPRVAERWGDPSALPRMTVGDLAAHLLRSVTLVEEYLDAPVPDDGEPVAAGPYFGLRTGLDDLDSALNAGVRERSSEDAAPGHPAVVSRGRDVLDRLDGRLPAEDPGRLLPGRGVVVTLEEFLRTRLVEFAVHTDDLAVSVGVPAPDAGAAEAVAVLVEAARARHGDLAVLRSLARRERDDVDAGRVF